MAITILNPARFNDDGGLGTRQFVRAAFFDEGYGVSNRLSGYAQGAGIVPATAPFNGIGAGTVGDPLRLSQFSGFTVPSLTVTETQTVTVGSFTYKGLESYGFSSALYGACSDGTFGFASEAFIIYLNWSNLGTVLFQLEGNIANSGWTKMTVNSTDYNRANATYTYDGDVNTTSWSWSENNNPFGTTNGATRAVVFTQ